jgi:hypothetical protein
MPKPIEIPFPLGTAPGIRAQESAGRVINAYVEPLGPTAMAGRVWRRAPGLTNFGTSTHTGYRGAIEVNGTLYAAIDGGMTKWTSAGGAGTDLTGTMTGTKRGFFARNNAVTPNIVFVDPDGSIALITAGSPGSISTTYPDLDLPAVNSVCGLDGYLVFTTGSGLAYATDLNSTAVNALSFGSADAKPDALTRAVAFGRLLILAGPSSTEFWQDVGAFPFPFQRGEVRPLGLIGPYAIAGDQDGFGKALFQVGHDNGGVRVAGLRSGQDQPARPRRPDRSGDRQDDHPMLLLHRARPCLSRGDRPDLHLGLRQEQRPVARAPTLRRHGEPHRRQHGLRLRQVAHAATRRPATFSRSPTRPMTRWAARCASASRAAR